MKGFRHCVFSLVVLSVCSQINASAAPIITQPSGLSPGDTYRLVFVTSTVRDAQSASIADYNAFVLAAANSVSALQSLGTSWTAMGSTLNDDARDNTSSNPNVSVGERIFTLNDSLVATNYADLWDGALLAPINFTEQGTTKSGFTWTGSNGFGVKDPFNLYLASSIGVELGNVNSVDGRWIATGFSPDNTVQQSFYAISGVLTAVVPEPSTVLIAVFGVVGAVGFRRLRMSRA